MRDFTNKIVPQGILAIVFISLIASTCIGCERRKQNFAGIDESAGNPQSEKKIEAHTNY